MAIAPEDCQTMEELRQGIDEIDQELVTLLAERVRFIDRASEIKAEIGLPARIGDRVEEVVGNVRRAADVQGLPPDLAEQVWRGLIEWSIAREETALGPSGEKRDDGGDH